MESEVCSSLTYSELQITLLNLKIFRKKCIINLQELQKIFKRDLKTACKNGVEVAITCFFRKQFKPNNFELLFTFYIIELRFFNLSFKGQYEPHWDHQSYPGAQSSWDENQGSRIATWLTYMSQEMFIILQPAKNFVLKICINLDTD